MVIPPELEWLIYDFVSHEKTQRCALKFLRDYMIIISEVWWGLSTILKIRMGEPAQSRAEPQAGGASGAASAAAAGASGQSPGPDREEMKHGPGEADSDAEGYESNYSNADMEGFEAARDDHIAGRA